MTGAFHDGEETIGVSFVIAQHHVMFGIQVIVAPVFREQQPVEENLVTAWIIFTEQGSPQATQRLFLDFSLQTEQRLARVRVPRLGPKALQTLQRRAR